MPAAIENPPANTDIDLSLFDAPANPEPASQAPASQSSSPDEGIDLKDFKAPSIADMLAGRTPEPAKPVEIQPDPAPANEPGPKHLREAYNKLKAEHAAIQSQMQEAASLREQSERELQEARQQAKSATDKLGYKDPSQHPDILRLQEPLDREFKELGRRLLMRKDEAQNLDRRVPGLVNEFRAIGDPTSDGYDERRGNFLEGLKDSFPEHHNDIRQFIAKAADTFSQVENRLSEIKRNGGIASHEEAMQQWRTVEQNYKRDVEEAAFTPDQGLRESAPFHPKVVLADMAAQNPKVAALLKQALDDARTAILPDAPINQKDLEAMPPEERESSLKERHERKRTVGKKVIDQIPLALATLRMFPSLMKRLTELEGKERARLDGQPGLNPIQPEKPQDQELDIKDYKPEPIPKTFR